MTKLDQLIVEFGADFSEMQKAFARAQRETQTSMNAINTALKAGSSAMFGLVAGAGAGLAAYFSVDFVKGALDAVGGLGELAEQLGTTTEQLQVLRYAAVENGVATQELEAGLAKFTRTMGEAAKGNDTAIKSFRDLGIGILDADGQARATTDVFMDAAEAIAAIDDPARRAATAVEFFGRGGQKLLPILSQGRQGLEEYTRAAREAGVVMSEEMIAKADQASDAWARFSFQARTQLNALVVQAIPYFETLGKAATWLIDTLQKNLLDDKSTVDEIAASVEKLTRLQGDLARTQQQLGDVGAAEPERIKRLRQEIELEQNRLDMLRERQRIESGQKGADAFRRTAGPTGPNTNPQGDAEAKKVEAFTQALEKQAIALQAQVDAFGMTELAAARLRREREAMLALGVAEADQLPEQIQATLGRIAAMERELATRQALAAESKKAQDEAIAYETAAADVVRKRDEATKTLRFETEEEIRLLKEQVEAAKQNTVGWNELTQAYEVHNRQLQIVMKTQDLLRKNTELTAEEARRLAEEWVTANEELREANDASRNEADKLNGLGRDLGLTFTSAFEDAVVGGKKLSDVLRGLAQDLLRLAIRKQVTEPLLELFSVTLGGGGGKGGGGGLFGDILGGLFGATSSTGATPPFLPFAPGGYADGTMSATPGLHWVGEDGPELMAFNGGERVYNSRDSARLAGGDTYYIDARNADAAGLARVERMIRDLHGSIEKRAVAAVADTKLRGGGLRAALQG